MSALESLPAKKSGLSLDEGLLALGQSGMPSTKKLLALYVSDGDSGYYIWNDDPRVDDRGAREPWSSWRQRVLGPVQNKFDGVVYSLIKRAS